MHFILSILAVFRLVIVPVQFQDREMEHDFADLERSVSIASAYFNRQFNGERLFSFTLVNPVTVSHEMSYYGANYPDTHDVLLPEMIVEATRLASAVNDFSRYAQGGSSLEHIIFLTAGHGEESGGGPDSIHARTGTLRSSIGAQTVNGYRIDSFSVCNEYCTGTLCHEFGHFLGLPDFYDTDAEASGGQSPGLLNMSLMDDGCRTGFCVEPPDMNAIELELLGIGNAKEMSNGSHSLSHVTLEREYLLAEGTHKGESFMVEFRKGKGLVIYRMDRSETDAGYSDAFGRNLTAARRWELNQVNCRPDRMCASVIWHGDSEKARLSGGVVSLDPGISMAIKDIATGSDKAAFSIFEPLVVSDIASFQDAAIVQWSTDDAIRDIVSASASWWKKGEERTTADLHPSARSLTIEGLEPSTEYGIEIEIVRKNGAEHSILASFTTKSFHESSYPYIYLNGVARNVDGSFPAGTRIPLRAANVKDAARIEWTLDGRAISTDATGYFTVRAGLLKAHITYSDGTEEYLSKTIAVR